jgi:hypothetical protein
MPAAALRHGGGLAHLQVTGEKCKDLRAAFTRFEFRVADQTGATRAPRRNKDLMEEALFDSRRSLFNDLSVVLRTGRRDAR